MRIYLYNNGLTRFATEDYKRGDFDNVFIHLTNKINNLFELYGFDIMIDEKFKAWLIEVNVNPSLHCTSPLDLNLKTDLITDILNVVGISPYNHNNNGETIYNYLMKKTKIDFDINNDLFPKLRFTRNNFFDLYNDFENYVNNNKNINMMANNIPFRSLNNNNLMTMKSNIMKNFNPTNLKQKLPEYDNEYYKNIIEIFEEERARSEMTNFNLIFPLKNNVELYRDIMVKSNTLNDFNIVLWQHILSENLC